MKEIKKLAELNDTFKENDYVLVDFWAGWCNPCKALVPVLERIKKDIPKLKIVKVNVEDNTALAQAFGVQSLPTLIIFKSGKDVDRVVGLVSEPKIKKMITEAMK
jgi:thioredoxin 1